MVLIQEIICIWSKELRSAGELRRHIPNALEIGDDKKSVFTDSQVIHHSVYYSGENNFKPANIEFSVHESSAPLLFQAGALLIKTHPTLSNTLSIKFKWSPEIGAPPRPDRHILNLEKGQWLQAVYNGRTAINGTLHTDWRYMLRTTNVAFVDQFNRNIFMSSNPIHTFEDQAQLR